MEVKREKLDEGPKTGLVTLSLSERASETHVSSGFGVGLFEKTTALQNIYIWLGIYYFTQKCKALVYNEFIV